MAPVRIAINVMPIKKAERIAFVNEQFAKLALTDNHRSAAHAMKLRWATSDRAKLQDEAKLRGITVDELAALIIAKSSDETALAERELKRQQIMARIEACTTPDELDAI